MGCQMPGSAGGSFTIYLDSPHGEVRSVMRTKSSVKVLAFVHRKEASSQIPSHSDGVSAIHHRNMCNVYMLRLYTKIDDLKVPQKQSQNISITSL